MHGLMYIKKYKILFIYIYDVYLLVWIINKYSTLTQDQTYCKIKSTLFQRNLFHRPYNFLSYMGWAYGTGELFIHLQDHRVLQRNSSWYLRLSVSQQYVPNFYKLSPISRRYTLYGSLYSSLI